jgi:hypothetical protein
MKKQTFLLLGSIYSTLIGVVLIFIPNSIFQAYGFPSIDQIPHEVLIGTAKDFIFYTGVNALALGIIYYFAIKGTSNKSVFLAGAIALIVCGIYIIYRNGNANTPIAAWIDMAIRLGGGLGFLYYYFTEKE